MAWVKHQAGDVNAAYVEFQAALEEARRWDTGGAREMEVWNHLALHYDSLGDVSEALRCRQHVETLMERFPPLS